MRIGISGLMAAALYAAIFCISLHFQGGYPVFGAQPNITFVRDPYISRKLNSTYLKNFDLAEREHWSIAPLSGAIQPKGQGVSAAAYASDEDRKLAKECWSYPYITVMAPRSKDVYEKVLAERPNFFYAEYFLSAYYRGVKDEKMANYWFIKSLRDAPAVLAGRVEYDDGSPVVGFQMGKNIIFASSPNQEFNDNKETSFIGALFFPYVVTDKNGCWYLPVFRTYLSEASIGFFPVKHMTFAFDTPIDSAIEKYCFNTKIGVEPAKIIRRDAEFISPGLGKTNDAKHPILVNRNIVKFAWNPYPNAATYRLEMWILGRLNASGNPMEMTGSGDENAGPYFQTLGATGTSAQIDMRKCQFTSRFDRCQLRVIPISADHVQLSSGSIYFKPG
jgi:hypothetical protein